MLAICGALLVFFEGPALFLVEVTGLSVQEVQGWIGFPLGILGYALLNPELLFGQPPGNGCEDPDLQICDAADSPKRPKPT